MNFWSDLFTENPTVSANTNINPISKPGVRGWLFTLDFRHINDLIIPVAPVVPADSSILLLFPPPSHVFFIVADLFFFLFQHPCTWGLTNIICSYFQRRKYTWTCMPQGFTDSPAVFFAIVRDALVKFAQPSDSLLLQYTGDLLLIANSKKTCRER